MSNVGKIYPSEKFSFQDPETKAHITQYTREGSVNLTLYFTNRPYVCDGEHVVFNSNRTGRYEMFLLNLKGGKLVQLTELEGMPRVSNCIHPHRPELYFHNRKSLYRVRLDTLETVELFRAPAGFGMGILNLNNPPWLAFELSEDIPGISVIKNGKPDTSSSNGEKHFLRPRTLIYRYHVDDGKLECLWSELKLLTHVQMSPTNPDLLIYSDYAGYGAERVQYIDLRKKLKSPPRALLGETTASRGTHECFTRRGNLYLQWMEGNIQETLDHTLMHAFKSLAGVSIEEVEKTAFKRYAVPERCAWMAHHFTMSEDETWGVNDRLISSDWPEEKMSWLCLFRHQEKEPQTILMKLCFQNGFHGDVVGLGPDLTLDNRDEYATYTSFLRGQANICQVHVTPFAERLMDVSG